MKSTNLYSFGLVFLAVIGLMFFIPNTYTQDEFKPYLIEIDSWLNSNCVDNTVTSRKEHRFIRFGKTPKDKVGVCIRYSTSNDFDIYISEKYWKIETEAVKYELLAHEVAHCELLTPHRDDPDSFMNGEELPRLTKEEVKEQFINEVTKVCITH